MGRGGRAWTRCLTVSLVTALCGLVPVGGAVGKQAEEKTAFASGFSFWGDARALSLSIGGRATDFGSALSRTRLLPEAVGAAAAWCESGTLDDIDRLPCGKDGLNTSRYPGGQTPDEERCSKEVPSALRGFISIGRACTTSTSGLKDDLPFAEGSAKVPAVRALLGFADVLPIDSSATKPEIDQVTTYLTGLFASALDVVARDRLSTLEDGVRRLVAGYVRLARDLPTAPLVDIRLGRSSSAVSPERQALSVVSTTSGARIGVLPLPKTSRAGTVALGDPLRDGLLVIEVGGAGAAAQVHPDSAASTSSASAATVLVQVRDLSRARRSYINVAVAEGESVTVLEGTPWESTVTAGSAVSERNVGSATSTAEPATLALLTGMVGGGAKLEVGAASAIADLTAEPRTPSSFAVPQSLLPDTGGGRPMLFPLALVAGAIGILAVPGARSRARRTAARAGTVLRSLPKVSSSDLHHVSVEARHRAYRTLAALLAVVGIALFSYPLVTDLWAARIQGAISPDFSGMAASYVTKQIEVGEPLIRLEIPRLGVNTLVVEGITPKALQAGAGHYPMTPLPGEPGNVAVAGHRTSFGSPFARIDELRPGDEIVLTTPVDRHTYEVLGEPSVADPTDWSIITDHPKDGSFLTLTSCHPEGSDEYRIWVRAELAASTDREGEVG